MRSFNAGQYVDLFFNCVFKNDLQLPSSHLDLTIDLFNKMEYEVYNITLKYFNKILIKQIKFFKYIY